MTAGKLIDRISSVCHHFLLLPSRPLFVYFSFFCASNFFLQAVEKHIILLWWVFVLLCAYHGAERNRKYFIFSLENLVFDYIHLWMLVDQKHWLLLFVYEEILVCSMIKYIYVYILVYYFGEAAKVRAKFITIVCDKDMKCMLFWHICEDIPTSQHYLMSTVNLLTF